MKPFPCSVCQQLLFFDNSTCLRCGSPLGYLPDEGQLVAVRLADGAGRTRRWCRRSISPLREPTRRSMQLADPGRKTPLSLCASCRLTSGTPERQRVRLARRVRRRRGRQTSLAPPADGARSARRRSLRSTTERGVSFEFLSSRGRNVTTGHEAGVITLDLSESDDAHREFVRQQLGEPYRTVLGHLRHEIGHYYWPRLVVDNGHARRVPGAVRRRASLLRRCARAALLRQRQVSTGPAPT